jgi:hypothetical protein
MLLIIELYCIVLHLRSGKHLNQQIGHSYWKCAIAPTTITIPVADAEAMDKVKAMVRAHKMPVQLSVKSHLKMKLMNRAQPNLTIHEMKVAEGMDVDLAMAFMVRVIADY